MQADAELCSIFLGVCYTHPDSLRICIMGWGWLGGTFGHYPLRPLDKNDWQPQTHTSTLGVEDSQFDEHIFQMAGSTTNQNCFHFISVFWDFLPNLAGYSRCGMPWGVPWADIACSTCFASTGDAYGCCIWLRWNQWTKWDRWKCCQCFENENQSGADNHWLPTACAGRPRVGRHIIWRQTSGQGKTPTWGGSQYNLRWFDQNSAYLLSKWHKVTLPISFVWRHQRHNVPWLVTCGWFLASCATGIQGSCCTGRISWWMSCPIWRYLPCSLRAPCVSWHWSRIGR